MRKSGGNAAETDLLLHPELLSEDFIKLVLRERKICTEDNEERDKLTDLYIQHVIPLPQRDLPKNRWGRRMEKTKACQSSSSVHSSSTDGSRKRPLIVYDGSSTCTVSAKQKKAEDLASSAVTDRLKPPPSTINLSNPIRKLSGSSTNPSSWSSTVSSSQAPTSASGGTKSPTGNGNVSSSGHSSNMSTKLKRESPSDGVPGSPEELKSPEVKKKIQHVTWP